MSSSSSAISIEEVGDQESPRLSVIGQTNTTCIVHAGPINNVLRPGSSLSTASSSPFDLAIQQKSLKPFGSD